MRETGAKPRGGRTPLADGGFSLVEILLAVFVLAVGVTLVLGSFGSSIDALGNSAEYTRGLALVEAKLWELEAQGSIVPGTSTGRFAEEDREFGWEVNASDLGEPRLCETRVTVTWEHRGRPRSVSVVTYLRRE
jgi:prepilin-type N-terminal cleavage/methylation domain-containing protein